MLLQGGIILAFMGLASSMGCLVGWLLSADRVGARLTRQNNALIGQLEAAETQVETLTEQLQEATAAAQQHGKKSKNLEQKLNSTEDQLSQTNSNYWDQFEHSVVAQEGEIAELRSKYSEQAHQIKRLTEENERLRNARDQGVGAAPAPMSDINPNMDIATEDDLLNDDFLNDDPQEDDGHFGFGAPDDALSLDGNNDDFDDPDDDEGLANAFANDFDINGNMSTSESTAAASLLDEAPLEDDPFDDPDDDEGLANAFANDFDINGNMSAGESAAAASLLDEAPLEDDPFGAPDNDFGSDIGDGLDDDEGLASAFANDFDINGNMADDIKQEVSGADSLLEEEFDDEGLADAFHNDFSLDGGSSSSDDDAPVVEEEEDIISFDDAPMVEEEEDIISFDDAPMATEDDSDEVLASFDQEAPEGDSGDDNGDEGLLAAFQNDFSVDDMQGRSS